MNMYSWVDTGIYYCIIPFILNRYEKNIDIYIYIYIKG